jgi:hypothetical protein
MKQCHAPTRFPLLLIPATEAIQQQQDHGNGQDGDDGVVEFASGVPVMDWLRSTSFSRLMPSGVSSNAQAKISTTGKPSASNSNTSFATHSGKTRMGTTTSTTCNNTQPRTR